MASQMEEASVQEFQKRRSGKRSAEIWSALFSNGVFRPGKEREPL